MNNKTTSRSKHIDFIILDLICVEISYLIAYYIRLGNAKWAPGDYYMMNIMILLVHVALVFFTECYSGIIRRSNWAELRHVVMYNCEVLAIVLVILFFIRQSKDYSRIIMAVFFVINNILMYVVRYIRKRHLKRINKKTGKLSRMLLLTDSDHVEKYVSGLHSYNYSSFNLIGVAIMDENRKGETIGDIPVVSDLESIYEYVRTNVVDEVFIGYTGDELSEIVNRLLAMGVMVHVGINRLLPDAPNSILQNINEYTVITTSINLMSFKQKLVKRLADIIISIPGLIVTGILTVILGPIIYFQSPGPIFFKQERVGKNGRIFKIYKFRSMYMDAEERKKELMEQNKMSGLMFKMDDDPRVTPVGKFIRKTSLDEFPQFINIFKGDMSLVGTRPPTVDEYKQYEQHHKSRLAIKPGLTGLWQVSGRSDITDFEEVVRLDNEYIRHFSLGYDVRILLKTVAVVFGRKGSV